MNSSRSWLRWIVGGSRILLGFVLLLNPRYAARTWLGPDGASPGVALLFRSIGARDVALGAGLLTAPPGDTAWARAGTVADVGDAGASLLNLRSVPARRVLPGAALAAVFAVAGAVLSVRVGR
ncbi:hypothetical protein [Mycobacterium sp. ACS4331]|uniref:hypothetical protein n=1 Tax=Mycobacterium sp. ACS4331 TaxID=1834121 RepID=UPI0007FE4BA9|nr:hypothetical protein [Mycobacterium sp. ACS4331]OBF10926.1 hypothetical protein A5727_21280 [Mycobacterium sp. ACS4331]